MSIELIIVGLIAAFAPTLTALMSLWKLNRHDVKIEELKNAIVEVHLVVNSQLSAWRAETAAATKVAVTAAKAEGVLQEKTNQADSETAIAKAKLLMMI